MMTRRCRFSRWRKNATTASRADRVHWQRFIHSEWRKLPTARIRVLPGVATRLERVEAAPQLRRRRLTPSFRLSYASTIVRYPDGSRRLHPSNLVVFHFEVNGP